MPTKPDQLAANTQLMKTTILLLLDLGLLIATCADLLAQAVPHHFSDITLLPDKTVTLQLDGSVAQMFNLTGTISSQFMRFCDLYVVEASTTLVDWRRLAMLSRTNSDPGPLRFHDPSAADRSTCFYRTFTNHLITMYPHPNGPFTVGRVDRVTVDPARTSPYRYTPATNALMLAFWYPANPPAAGELPAATWDRHVAADTSFYTALGMDAQWVQVSPALVGHELRNVPLASGTAK